jgi:hypothetical protein
MLAVGEIDVFTRRDPAVMNDDNFNNGPQGWVQLISGQYPEGGPIMLDSEITAHGSRYSLFLQSGTNNMDGVNDCWGGCVAIKRMYRHNPAKKIYMEWLWAFGTEFKYDTPRTVFFGLDTCDAAANRRFFQTRWLAATKAYQVFHNGTWTDLPGVTYPHAFNENKRNLNHTEVVFDLENNRYDGLRVNGIGYGSLAPTPDGSLNAYGPLVENLPTFEGGFNPVIGFYNSNTDTTTHGWMNLAHQRTVIVK